jgi:3-hydroxypropanoate dehydrogenase
MPRLPDTALDQLFRLARSQNTWRATQVTDCLLQDLADLVKMGPTSANSSPARFVFLTTQSAKQRLAQHASQGNRAKILSAPVTAIIGYDTEFYEKLPKLFPHTDARGWFAGNPALSETTAFRNGSLQGAYLILAARALGLDTGPMSGFDNAAVDREFFPGGTIKSNFICGLGHGDPSGVFARSPRFAFEEFCSII